MIDIVIVFCGLTLHIRIVCVALFYSKSQSRILQFGFLLYTAILCRCPPRFPVPFGLPLAWSLIWSLMMPPVAVCDPVCFLHNAVNHIFQFEIRNWVFLVEWRIVCFVSHFTEYTRFTSLLGFRSICILDNVSKCLVEKLPYNKAITREIT